MNTSLSLSIPPPATRQVGVSIMGSPLSRSVSDTQTPEESLRQRLQVYKTYLEHEIQFVESEIQAILDMPIRPLEEHNAFMDLRNGLKIRFNTLQTKLSRVNALLEVL